MSALSSPAHRNGAWSRQTDAVRARPYSLVATVVLVAGAALGLTRALASTVPPAPGQIDPVELSATTTPETSASTATTTVLASSATGLTTTAPSISFSGTQQVATAHVPVAPTTGPPAEAPPVTVPATTSAPERPGQSGEHVPTSIGNGTPGGPNGNGVPGGPDMDLGGPGENTDSSGQGASENESSDGDDLEPVSIDPPANGGIGNGNGNGGNSGGNGNGNGNAGNGNSGNAGNGNAGTANANANAHTPTPAPPTRATATRQRLTVRTPRERQRRHPDQRSPRFAGSRRASGSGSSSGTWS